MKIFEKMFLMYYFLIRKDKNFSKKGRTIFLIEIILTMLFATFLLIVYGLLKIRIDNLINVSLFTILSLSMGYIFTYFIYIKKGRENEIIKKGEKYTRKEIKILLTIGALSIPLVFFLMILGAILMSYLLS